MASEGEHPRYVAPRERMRNRFLRYLGALARFFEEHGAVERAADLYHRALDADPLSESCYRRLMLCYRSLGRQAEAVEIYDRCRRILRAELGVDPSPETAAIHRSLLKDL
jgi:two-component SAPR family response regulator